MFKLTSAWFIIMAFATHAQAACERPPALVQIALGGAVRLDAPAHDVKAPPECLPHVLHAAPEALPPVQEYVKQTEFDNTPYRFNMTQNGKRMTADDFDVWLQANGYSVGRRAESVPETGEN